MSNNLNNANITMFKNKVADMLLSNDELIEALNIKDNDVQVKKDLMYRYIYPYPFVDEVQETERTIICYSLDFPTINSRNEYFKNAVLTFYIIVRSKTGDMRTDKGVQTDVIAELIDDMFAWNNNFGQQLIPLSNVEDALSQNYHMRIMKYHVTSMNSLECGNKHVYK